MTFGLYLLTMASVTYLVRMLPMVLIKKKIENRFLLSFLYYIPYTVLTVMTVPAILYSTSSVLSAVVGTATALVLAFFNKGLLTVAGFSCAAVLITELILQFAF